MMDAVGAVDDSELRSHAHTVRAQCYELAGDAALAVAEHDRAVDIARAAATPASLALALYHRARFLHRVPENAACIAVLDEVDGLVARFGLRRYAVPAGSLRAMALASMGEVEQAVTLLASVQQMPAEGHEAWFRGY